MPGSNAFSAAHPAAIPKVVGFLLVYYPDYMNLAVRRFESVISQLDADHVVLVIENAPMPRLAPARTRTIVIQGDNSLREFSGWMAGVRYCEAQGWLDANPLLIFANDTFCHHNKFGLVTKRAFASSFRKLLRARSHAMIAGELQGGAYELSILGHACKSWISTYLFAMTTPLLRRIVSFVPPIDMDSFLNVEGVDDQFFCGPVNAPSCTLVV